LVQLFGIAGGTISGGGFEVTCGGGARWAIGMDFLKMQGAIVDIKRSRVEIDI
jgi:hypothetical protein